LSPTNKSQQNNKKHFNKNSSLTWNLGLQGQQLVCWIQFVSINICAKAEEISKP